ncbi:hypothetical protein [Streptomyces sp. NPDC093269]|uniref:hypothetical protein n=1 Tax=Streptomyces sp. NPDC093269 TaxID=3366038 RepID=UPI0037F7EE58
MSIIRSAAAVLLLTASLAACSNSSSDTAGAAPSTPPAKASSPTPKASPSVDCSDQSLDQATWVENCSDAAGGGGESSGLTFGQAYTWDDGLKVTVLEVKQFTDYNKDAYETPTPGTIDFRIKLRITNSGKTPADLSKLSTITDGATNGGEASSTTFENGSEPLEGRLAPGVTVTKTDDNELETKYGRKIVVTVQRVTDDLTADFPEFTGTIAG